MDYSRLPVTPVRDSVAAFRRELIKLKTGDLNHLPLANYPKWARRDIDAERNQRKSKSLDSMTSVKVEERNHITLSEGQDQGPAASSIRSDAIIFTDATPTQGAWVNHHGSTCAFPVPRDFQNSSFESEFYSAYVGILENAAPGKSVHLHCDNQDVCSVLEKGKTRNASVKRMNRDLQSWLATNNISLTVSWVPSKQNPADRPSRS